MRLTVPIAAAGWLVASTGLAQTREPPAARPDSSVSPTPAAVSHERGRLGLSIAEMTEELRAFFGAPRGAGVLVSKVIPDSVAAKAGVQVGDVIIKVDASTVSDAKTIRETTASKMRGTVVVLTVVRAKRQIRLNARLDNEPVEEPEAGQDWHFGPGELLDPWKMERRSLWRWHWPRSNVEDRLRDLERRLDDLQKRLPHGIEPNKS